jgi:diadenosine tetraphosphate (Ap4A) HIT family hydrolase
MARAGPSTVAWSATRPGWACRSIWRRPNPPPTAVDSAGGRLSVLCDRGWADRGAPVGRDEQTVSSSISPGHGGHALAVPRRHADGLGLEHEEHAQVARAAGRVARLLRGALNPAGVSLVHATGGGAWQSVFHFHVHVVPRYRLWTTPSWPHGERGSWEGTADTATAAPPNPAPASPGTKWTSRSRDRTVRIAGRPQPNPPGVPDPDPAAHPPRVGGA